MTMTQPLLGFSPDTFARRRGRVLQELDGGAMLLPAAPLRYRSRDTEYRYRPDSELFYLTGWVEPRAVALLSDAPSADSYTLFVPRRDPKTELWSGPRLGPEEAKAAFAADEVHPLEALEEHLPGLLEGTRRVFSGATAAAA